MVVVLVIFLKVFIIDVYALSAAPIMGEALVEVFSALLLASGYTSEEVGEMSWNDAETAINDGISSGTINPLQVVGDVTVNGITTSMNFMEWLSTSVKATSDVVTSDVFGTITNVAVKTALSNSLPGTIGSWVNNLTQEDVVATPTTDIKGYGCKVVIYKNFGSGYVEASYYADYAIVSKTGSVNIYGETCYFERSDGKFPQTVSGGWSLSSSKTYIGFYGDIRYEDGTQAPTDDETTTEVGETADGEKVTLENIQSGAVSADDTTLDYDKFNTEAIIDLLQQILDTMENVPVVEDTADNTIAEDFAQELEGSVAIELEDISALQLPTGIATVFPFCLPFDFAYGLELLATKPVAPKFEIPFEIPAFGLYPGTSDVITLDFAKYSKYFNVGRWVQVIIFSIGLCFISFKVVKGVH